MNDLIGQHLGPYRILEQIGTGGMAAVYKAYQPAMDRYVAVKVIASHFARDEKFQRRFRREARAVAQLEHAHILPVHDYGEAEGRPYLVMRFLEAGTLKDRMAQGPLPLSEVNRIIGQVGGALDYAHRMGVIHRDVKPTNVLLDAEGDAFLTDFGLAKMMEASAPLTETGVGIGTPTYMSPEQGKGAKVDSRSDVYSLGIMLYQMVTGRPPYEAETPLAVVLKHIQEPLPLPRTIRPDLPEEVERVILRALAKEVDDRFQTAGEMVRALDAAVQALEAADRTEPTALAAGPGPTVAEQAAPPAEGLLFQAVAGVRKTLPARWGQVVMGVVVGIIALLAFFLVLSRVPLRVQITGGQLEVVRMVEVATAPTLGPTGVITDDIYIVTDGTWKSSRNPSPGWQQPDYDDSSWGAVDSEPCQEFPGAQPAMCLWDYPYTYVRNNTVYFRKAVEIHKVPPRARIVTLVDDDVDIYLNGTLVLHDGEDVGTDGISWWELDVTDLIRPGVNVLAFQGTDTGEGIAYVQAGLGLCFGTEDRYNPRVEIMNHWEGWYDGDLYIEAVDALCDSGVVEVAYRVDGGSWRIIEPHERFQLSLGEHDVEVRATDGAGRQGFDSWHFLVGQPPFVATTPTNTPTSTSSPTPEPTITPTSTSTSTATLTPTNTTTPRLTNTALPRPTSTPTPGPVGEINTGMGGSLSVQGVVRDSFGNVLPYVYVGLQVCEKERFDIPDFETLAEWGLHTDDTGSYSFSNLLRVPGGHYIAEFTGYHQDGVSNFEERDYWIEENEIGGDVFYLDATLYPITGSALTAALQREYSDGSMENFLSRRLSPDHFIELWRGTPDNREYPIGSKYAEISSATAEWRELAGGIYFLEFTDRRLDGVLVRCTSPAFEIPPGETKHFEYTIRECPPMAEPDIPQ
jgi:tRNA A-37 threonylcarbamoyl transferase component Bud32